MIETAARLVQARGFHGVSLGDILSESGTPRGSLYFHFPGGKEDLVLEAMRAGIEEASRVLRECLAETSDPAAGIRRFFEAAAAEMTDSDYAFGCPVAPVVLDTVSGDSALAQACRAAFDEWEHLYRDALTGAGLAPRRAERMARLILASLEGALITSRSRRDADEIRAVGEEVAMAIAAALNGDHPASGNQ